MEEVLGCFNALYHNFHEGPEINHGKFRNRSVNRDIGWRFLQAHWVFFSPPPLQDHCGTCSVLSEMVKTAGVYLFCCYMQTWHDYAAIFPFWSSAPHDVCQLLKVDLHSVTVQFAQQAGTCRPHIGADVLFDAFSAAKAVQC